MIKHFFLFSLIGITLTACTNTDSLSGDVYTSSEAKQVQSVTYGILLTVRPVKIQTDNQDNIIGAIGGAVLGGFLGNTIGGGTGRNLAIAGGAVAGGLAGQGVQGTMNKVDGVELEIRKDDGNTIIVVQKQDSSLYTPGQRVALASNGRQITVSPR